MVAISWLIERFNDLSSYFYVIYLEVYWWIAPFDQIAPFFYGLAETCNQIAWNLADFYDWVADVSGKVSQILDLKAINDYFWPYFSAAFAAWEWVQDAVINTVLIVDDWWLTTKWIITGYVDDVRDLIEVQVNNIQATVDSMAATWSGFWTITWPDLLSDIGGLRSSWENFLAGILPGLATWTGVDDLVQASLRSWFPFYDEIVSLWGDIREFFTAPEDWLYNRLDGFFERFW